MRLIYIVLSIVCVTSSAKAAEMTLDFHNPFGFVQSQYTEDSTAVTSSLPFKESKGEDHEIVGYLMPFVLSMHDISEQRRAFELSYKKRHQLDEDEISLASQALQQYGLQNELLFKRLSESENRIVFLRDFPHTLRLLAQIYFRSGQLLLTTEVKVPQSILEKIQWGIGSQDSSPLSKHEEAFFQIFTAASLNHKEARFYYAFFMDNGIIPSTGLVDQVTNQHGVKYNYLRYLVNQETSLVFKFIDNKESSYFQLSEYESDSKAQTLANLYLSAQVGSPYDFYRYEDDEPEETPAGISFSDQATQQQAQAENKKKK